MKHASDLEVGFGGSDDRVDDEDDGVGLIDRELGLTRHRLVEALDLQFPPACVEEDEPVAGPFRGVAHAVARDAGRVLDDGLAPAQHAVDERRFTYVGAPHDGEDGQRLARLVLRLVCGRVEQQAIVVAEVVVLQPCSKGFSACGVVIERSH